MSLPVDARPLLHESIPVAAILSFWTLLSLLALVPWLGVALRLAGLVMAGLYVWTSGTRLAGTVPQATRPTDLSDRTGAVLEENLGVLVAAGSWFLASLVLGGAFLVLEWVGLGEFVAFGLEPATFVLTGTGVATVLLYAIAADRAGPTMDK